MLENDAVDTSVFTARSVMSESCIRLTWKKPIKNKDIKLAYYFNDRYLSTEDSEFVELVKADIDIFVQSDQLDLVLLFPPVNSYLRLLIHKTAEDYSQLHTFSVGEGEGRQTVVCWKQAVISAEPEDNRMSSPRPPSSRGRGRGRLRDQHSQSPAARSNESPLQPGGEGPQTKTSSGTGAANAQPLDDSGAKADRRERRERKTKRPDVQVYVPRGRRLQSQQNNTTPVPNRPGTDVHAKDISAIPEPKSSKERNSPQPIKRSDVYVVENFSSGGPQGKNMCPEEMYDVRQAVKTENNSFVTEDAHTNFMDENQVSDKIQSGGNEISQKSDSTSMNINTSVLHSKGSQEHENRDTLHTCGAAEDIMNDDPSIVKLETGMGAGFERCSKKMKVSETLESNVSNVFLDNLTNLSDDAKIFHMADSQLQNENLNTVSESNNGKENSFTESESNNGSSDLIDSNSCTTHGILDSVQTTLTDCDKLMKKTEEANDLMQSEATVLEKSHSRFENFAAANESKGGNVNVCTEANDLETLPGSDTSSNTIDNSNLEEEGKFKDSGVSEEENNQVIHESQDKLAHYKDLSLSNDQIVNSDMNFYDNTVKISELDKCCDNVLCESGRHMRMEIKSNSEFIGTINKSELDNGSNLNNLVGDKICNDSSMAEQTSDDSTASTTVSELTNPVIITETDIADCSEESVMKMTCDDESFKPDGSCRNCDNDKMEKESYESGMSMKHNKGDDCTLDLGDHNKFNKDICESGHGELNEKADTSLLITSCENEDEIGNHPIQKEDFQSPPLANKIVETIKIDQSEERNLSAEDQSDEDSWDTMFDDNGDCLDPSAMEELTKTVGKVKIKKSKKINYLDYQPKDKSAELDYTEYGHIIEIYGFPAEFVTRDLIMAFQTFMSRGFDLKWVDDTHALGIFSSAIAAQDALNMVHPLLKVCPLSQASPQSRSKAKRCTEFLQPYKPRPETSAAAARRLVAGALGLHTRVPKEKREKERQQLKEAKAKKRQDKQNRDDIWEGRLGRCAMDEEG